MDNQLQKNSVPETQKGQEGASGEATGALQEWLAGVPEGMREQQVKMMENYCRDKEITMEELAEKLLDSVERMKKMWEDLSERLHQTVESVVGYLQKYFGDEIPDKWQLEKMKIPNNRRRRKKLPMVRRQAHIRNVRNAHKRRK